LVIETPVPDVVYILQDRKANLSTRKGPSALRLFLIFLSASRTARNSLVSTCVAKGPSGVSYTSLQGRQAGQKESCWSRRMKIDIHTIPKALIAKAKAGKMIEAVINGAGSDGTPACASVPLAKAWRAV
jgi:hypothetical protein